MNTSNKTTIDVAYIKDELLEILVELEKLKIIRKGILKDAAIIGFIGVSVILFGLYVHYAEWTAYPVIPFLIFAGGVLLAVALRPLQRYKKDFERAEKRCTALTAKLKKENLGYKADVNVSRNEQGAFDVEKSIEINTLS
ncbi:hypothetical protein [Kordia jejudonensis]|uniref:hypothetical protein n=1 Tax=Kordia jejudonensis TaxID=1348245 RepID=UPI0006296313|nr:hypothetical protein [Kordia jejudonensis]